MKSVIIFKQKCVAAIAFCTLIALCVVMTNAQDVPSSIVTPDQIVESESAQTQTNYSISPSDWEALNKRLESLESQLKDEKAKAAKKKEDDAKKPSVKVSGRLQYEADFVDQNEASKARVGNMRNGTELRRTWIGVAGSYKQFNYKCTFDLAPSSLAFKDVYLGIKELPVLGDMRIGYFKEPSSVEQLVGVHQMWFIERPLSMSGISSYMQNRAMGIEFSNGSRNENFLWTFGFFQNCSDAIHKHFDDDYDPTDARSGEGVTARFVKLLQDCPEYGRILHVGTSFTYKSWNPNEKMNWGTKPEMDLGIKCIGTGDFYGTTDTFMVSPELIFTNNSFAVFAEYNYIRLKNRDMGDMNFHGGHVSVSYMLTGEHYNYSKSTGTLTYIKPHCDFVRRCENGVFETGTGAWQVLYRFSWIDYRQMPILDGASGDKSKVGIAYDHTFGLNWQMSQTFRIMFNYILSNNEYKYGTLNKSGNVSVFTTSVQMYF
ncbi:MAG: hypothetical protein IJH67_08580 [Thermoguttaceae bacterium]|nr:hypothetical protein [Thermoguttaceae bacterium]